MRSQLNFAKQKSLTPSAESRRGRPLLAATDALGVRTQREQWWLPGDV
jgi:hypothetical protein